MKDYTLENPKNRDIKKRRRTQIRDLFIGIILFCLFCIFFIAGADWADTMSPKSLIICLSALLGGLAIAIFLNIREEL